MWVSAVAVSRDGESLIAATKGFVADHRGGERTLFEPDSALTKQIRSRFQRKRLLHLLEESGARSA
jgi:hypothetical protein